MQLVFLWGKSPDLEMTSHNAEKKNMEGTQNRTPKQKLWKSWNRYTMKLMRIGVLGGQGGY